MKKILVLGGKPIGSIELVKKAKDLGFYVIVTDYLPKDKSPAKQFADEIWDVSTADVDKICYLCEQNQVDAIMTAVHEFNINRMIDVCGRLKKPCYCSRETWDKCNNKVQFKQMCIDYGIPVAKKYDVNFDDCKSIENIQYPVIVKPVDGSGSRGFSICKNDAELLNGFRNALNYSFNKKVLVEDYIPYNAVIIHYTMINGKCYYSGMSDKISCRFESTGAYVMGIQTFPSKGENQYLETIDKKARYMFENLGIKNGPIWIEAFYDDDKTFIFNEMGFRFGGSLTNYPVKYFYNVDQLDLLIKTSFGIPFCYNPERQNLKNHYCILPIHIKPGVIKEINGVNDVLSKHYVNAFVPVHHIGDEIKAWGSAQQVFCYLHFLYEDYNMLYKEIIEVMHTLVVTDENDRNLLYTLFDIEKLRVMK